VYEFMNGIHKFRRCFTICRETIHSLFLLPVYWHISLEDINTFYTVSELSVKFTTLVTHSSSETVSQSVNQDLMFAGEVG
jgi:hypothetical protein